MLNKDVIHTHWFVYQNIMIEQQPFWEKPNVGVFGNDCIGTTFRAYITYRDECFIDGIISCMRVKQRKTWLGKKLFGENYIQIYRKPRKEVNNISRDHVIYAILALKHSNKLNSSLVNSLRFRISNVALMTPEMWAWLKVVSGNKKWMPLYFVLHFFALLFAVVWNKLIYKIGGFGEELPQHEFEAIDNKNKPKFKAFLASLLYPIYALHIAAWQIYSLPNGVFKRILSNIAFKLCPKHNYVIQYLLKGKSFPTIDDNGYYTDEVYKPMAMNRWTAILNPIVNKRALRIIKDEKTLEYNVLDSDYLKAVKNLCKK